MTTKRCERCGKENPGIHTCTPKEIERIKGEIEEEKQKQSKLYEEAKSKSKQIKEIHTEFFTHHKPFETMTEHEKLKEICDKIGLGDYAGTSYKLYDYIEQDNTNGSDVREIIFTQEFMDKYKEYYFDSDSEFMETDHIAPILFNLNNPVSFLYDLIK